MAQSLQDWRAREVAVNHDWLKNRYLPALGKWLNILAPERRVTDTIFEDSFPEHGLREWSQKEGEVRWVVEKFGELFGPERLFESGPLCGCSVDARRWLEPLSLVLWARGPGGRAQERAASARESVVSAYDRLIAFVDRATATPPIGGDDRDEPRRKGRSLVIDLRRACVELNHALSNLWTVGTAGLRKDSQ